MSSIGRIDASRANGAKSRGPTTVAGKLAALANSAKSTGPATPDGKSRSSQNATRHGILAESIVLDSESAERFSDVLTTLQEELQPVTSIESRRQEAADLGDSTEISPIRYTALAFRAMSDESRAQELLNRYESRYDRQYQRAMNGLRAYRADRKQDEREARRSHKTKNEGSATGESSVLRENPNES